MSDLAALNTYFNLMTMNGGAYVFNTVTKMQLLKPLLVQEKVTANSVATERGIKEETIVLLYDVLCSLDLLVKEGDHYSLGSVFKMLRGNYENLSSDYWEHLPHYIIEGVPYKKMDQVEESEEVYQNEVKSLGLMMDPSAHLLAKSVSGPCHHILDLGAGSGVWSSHFLQQNLESRVTCVDWPKVLKVAEERAKIFDISSRVSSIEGNYHEVEYGKNYDLAILGNVVHLETDDNLKLLFSKAYESLVDGGRILIVDCYGEDSRGELARSLYKLGLSLRTVEGRVPTVESLKALLSEAQFKTVEYIPLNVTPFTMGAYLATKS